MQDLDIARAYVAALTGSASTPMRFRLIHDRDRQNIASAERCGTIDAVWPELMVFQKKGYGVFYCVNPTRGDLGRSDFSQDTDVIAVRAVFADFDEGLPTLDNFHARPDLLVRTSKVGDVQKGQAIWLTDKVGLDEFKQVQARLIDLYKSDPAIKNLSRVFRLPGTLHQKGTPQLVTFEPVVGAENPLIGLPELPEVIVSKSVGDPVPMDKLVEVVDLLVPSLNTRDGWLALVAGARNSNVPDATEEQVLDMVMSRIDPQWHPAALQIWETMPPKLGGLGYGTMVKDARALGHVIRAAGAPEPMVASELFQEPPFFEDGADILKREVPPLVELIPGLVEKGIVTFLSAPGGSNKSRLAVQWGLCLNAGVKIFGRQTERCKFVYLSWEDTADEVARRMQTITRTLKLPLDNHFLNKDLTMSGPLAVVGDEVTYTDLHRALVKNLLRIEGHKFIVLDSTYDALSFTGNAKMNEASVMSGIGVLQQICHDTNSTIMTLWHPSKSAQASGDAGWSVAWHNKPRARLGLSAVENTDNVYNLVVEKRNNGPKPKHPITLRWHEGTLVPLTEIEDAEQVKAFNEALLLVALAAAEQGQPIQIHRKSPTWAIDEVETRSGRRPTEREFKEGLARLGRDMKLRYKKADNKTIAGYYPVDIGERTSNTGAE